MAILPISSPRTTAWSGTVASPQTFNPGAQMNVGEKYLVWATLGRTSPTPISVTDNSTQTGAANTYVKVGATVQNTNISLSLFYVDVTRNVLVTDLLSCAWTGGTAATQFSVDGWTGAASGAVASSVSATGNSSAPATGALSTSTAGDLVVAGFGLAAQVAYAVSNDGQGNTMTSLHAPTAASFKSAGVEYLVESGTLAYNPAGPSGWAGSNWVALGVRITSATPAPVNTVAPAVTGTPTVGSTLSCTTGTWTGDVSSGYAYQWKDVAGNIAGATSSTYVVGAGENSASVRCTVTATGTGGSTPRDSNTVGPITSTAPANSVAPAVTGTVRRGSTLSTTDGTWTNTPTSFTYQWQRNNVNIAAATANTYVLVAADVPTNVRCVVTGVNGGGSTPANSNTVGLIGGLFTEVARDVGLEVCGNDTQDLYSPGPVTSLPANTVLPAITGTPIVGLTLSTTNGTWTNSPTSIGYQWQQDNVTGGVFTNIVGATNATLVVPDGSDACNVQCIVTATNAAGSVPATSNTLGPVVEPPPVNLVAPLVTGVALPNGSLTTTNGTWLHMAGLGATFTYQWQSDYFTPNSYTPIVGTTESVRFVQDIDAGCQLQCVVTATNTGAATDAASNAVGPVPGIRGGILIEVNPDPAGPTQSPLLKSRTLIDTGR